MRDATGYAQFDILMVSQYERGDGLRSSIDASCQPSFQLTEPSIMIHNLFLSKSVHDYASIGSPLMVVLVGSREQMWHWGLGSR